MTEYQKNVLGAMPINIPIIPGADAISSNLYVFIERLLIFSVSLATLRIPRLNDESSDSLETKLIGIVSFKSNGKPLNM